MLRFARAVTLAASMLLAGSPAFANVVVGVRVFPVTVNFDDPGVGDELRLPQFIWQRNDEAQSFTQMQWEWDKTITPTTALIYNQGYGLLQSGGAKRRTGFENVFLTGKWQAYTNVEHEFVASLGVIREFAGGTATQGIGGDAYGSTSPAVWVGKGTRRSFHRRAATARGHRPAELRDPRPGSEQHREQQRHPVFLERRAIGPVQYSVSGITGGRPWPALADRASRSVGRGHLVHHRKATLRWFPDHADHCAGGDLPGRDVSGQH